MWIDQLYEPVFVERLMAELEENEKNPVIKITTYKKIKGFLKAILLEKEFYKNPVSYNIKWMFRYKNGSQPKKSTVCSAIRNAGFNVAMSYVHPTIIKTDAPYKFMMEMLAEWKKKDSDKDYKGSIDFSDNQDVKQMLKGYPARFLPNPEKNWGPKAAAKITLEKRENMDEEKDN